MNQVFMASTGTPEEQRNKDAVLSFYKAIIRDREFHRVHEWMDHTYKQHRPGLGDGPEPVVEFVKNEAKRNPTHQVNILKCFADGDFVILHVHIVLEPLERDRAVMDIFRVKNGRLLEHWDVDQEIPAKLTPHGMF